MKVYSGLFNLISFLISLALKAHNRFRNLVFTNAELNLYAVYILSVVSWVTTQ